MEFRCQAVRIELRTCCLLLLCRSAWLAAAWRLNNCGSLQYNMHPHHRCTVVLVSLCCRYGLACAGFSCSLSLWQKGIVTLDHDAMVTERRTQDWPFPLLLWFSFHHDAIRSCVFLIRAKNAYTMFLCIATSLLDVSDTSQHIFYNWLLRLVQIPYLGRLYEYREYIPSRPTA